MKAPTFADLYYEARKQPHPSVAFIAEIAEITHRTHIAVRKWITGENTPDYNCQVIIANYLGAPLEQLFPPKKNENNGKP